MPLVDESENDVDGYVNKEITDDIVTWVSSCRGLKILHVNIRSIRKNWSEFEAILQPVNGNFDIIVLTEISYVHEGENYKLNGYDTFFKARINKRGGGIALFIKNTFEFIEINNNFVNFEAFQGTVSGISGMSSLDLLAIYRPPSSNKSLFIEELDNFLVNTRISNMVLLGDINIDILQEEDTIAQSYRTLLSAYGFLSCISDVTREEHRLNTISKSCLDHIFVRMSDSTFHKLRSVIYTSKLSDHYMTGLNILGNDEQSANAVITKLPVFNEKKLSRLLQEVKWDCLLTETDCNIIYEKLVLFFNKCYDNASCIPTVPYKRKRVCKSWVTDEILNLIKERDLKFKLWKNCKSSLVKHYRSDYKKFRNQVNKRIHSSKINYYKAKITSAANSSKDTWQVINDIVGKRKRASVDEIIMKYIGRSNSLNELTNCFVSSFVSDVNSVIHKCDIRTGPFVLFQEFQSMRMPRVHASDIITIIDKLDISKQPGLDRIRVRDLKLLKNVISPVLALMINLSLRSGVVPDSLKVAIVKPIYKKGDHMEYSNYRPIAILPGIEQIEERCIANVLHDYLLNHKIINIHQFGFQKHKSTSDLLSIFSDFINSKLNDNKHVLGLFIDFSKAFDTLNHSKLILALESIGIRGHLLRWFENYLENRKILVRVGNVSSIRQHIKSGVPQGSILGPVLYLIYVNNLFHCIQTCKILMYADDTVILAAHRNLKIAENYLQSDFTKLLYWTHDHELVINANKTKLIHFSSPFNKDLDTPVRIVCHSYECIHECGCELLNNRSINCYNCNEIETVSNHTYLGIVVDRFLCWNPHIVKISNRLRAASFQIFQLRLILPNNVLKLVYHAIVESIMLYGILSYGNASFNHLRQIQVIQDRIVKTMVPFLDSKEKRYQHCNILPFHELFLYRFILKYYYCNDFKIIHKLNVNTRLQLCMNYVIPTYTNKYGKRQLSVAIPLIFNQLPNSMREICSFRILKLVIKSWLLEKL